MATKITFTNQKGGVLKTTSFVNFSAKLARDGYKVLAIDLDSQLNSTDTLLYQTNPKYRELPPSKTIARILGEDVDLTIYKTYLKNLDFVPAHTRLSRADSLFNNTVASELRLKKALEPVEDKYDFVMIDTPRDMNLMVKNALVVSDFIIIPFTPDYYALSGIKEVLVTVKDIREYHNPNLEILGFLMTVAEHTIITKETMKMMKKRFGNKVFKTTIPKNIHCAEAAGKHIDIFGYSPDAIAAKAYSKLTKELLVRIENSAK